MRSGTLLHVPSANKRGRKRTTIPRNDTGKKGCPRASGSARFNETNLWHWVYCTLVFSSGLFVGVDNTQPLYDKKQMLSEVMGFPTPNQLADLMLGEVEDLILVLTPVLTPIYGALGILRYPTKPLRIANKIRSVSILTYVKNEDPLNYQESIQQGLLHLVPTMYTTIKSEAQQEENLMGVLKTRAKKTGPLPKEYGPINWYDAPLDKLGVPVRYPWDFPTLRKYVSESL